MKSRFSAIPYGVGAVVTNDWYIRVLKSHTGEHPDILVNKI